VDFEDAVPIAEKESSLPIVRDILDKNPGKRMFVLVNALSTPYARDDVKALDSKNLEGIMLPKVESPDDLIEFDRLLLKWKKNQVSKKDP
jgi:citrate lyase subunit beta/citryl-CoA lyase